MSEIIASEGGHWYDENGYLVSSVPLKKPAADGRTTTEPTIRHARLLHLFPSVTTIGRIQSEPGLNRFLINRALKYGFEHRELADFDALLKAYNEFSSKPSDRGTLLHGGMERLLQNEGNSEDAAAIKAHSIFQEWLDKNSIARIGVESSFCNRHLGYAGKVDFRGKYESGMFATVDFKFVQKARAPLDKECVQGTAYNHGLGTPDAEFHNFLFLESTGELVEHKHWAKDDLEWGWDVFQKAFELWCSYNMYDPRKVA